MSEKNSPYRNNENPGRQTVLFAGIGNLLRQDDGAGVELCRKIKTGSHLRVILVEMSIENYIGKINSLNPDMLVMADCVDFGREPGYWEFLPAEKLADISFHTHHISLNTLSELFEMPVWILGIQPSSLEFGEGLSPAVKAATDYLAGLINQSVDGETLTEVLTGTCAVKI